MAINSLKYVIFVAIVVVIYYLFPKRTKGIVLLIASYVFYFINSSKLTIYLIITTISIYCISLLMTKIDKLAKEKCKLLEKDSKKIIKKNAKIKKKLLLVVALVINFGILIALKYCNFIFLNINSICNVFNIDFNIPFKNVVLPLGISYYTLQAVSYVVDVYRGKYKADKNFFRVALFVSFFPHIVEGPIGKYDLIADDIYNSHKFNYKNFTYSIQLILWGYFKKMVIADRAGLFVSTIFDNYTTYGGVIIIASIMLYTLQLYSEFSGCIDIVRGVAGLFGITLSENFKRPFFSKTVQEFWQRWHITLGVWLKEYVFYPISFSKLTVKITGAFKKIVKNNYITKILPSVISMFFVWLVMGIWHGASWKYVFYGMYYYFIMMAGMVLSPLFKIILRKLKINTQKKWYKVMQIIRTHFFVFIGMMIFRASTIKEAFCIFKSIFSFKSIDKVLNGKIFSLGVGISDFIIILVSVILLYIVGIIQEKEYMVRDKIAEKKVVVRWAIYYILLFSILIFGIYGKGYNASSFIYGNF